MFGMIKQSSFQLMDAVLNCWSSIVGRRVTKDNSLVYTQWFSKYWTSDKFVILFNDSITGGDRVKFYS